MQKNKKSSNNSFIYNEGIRFLIQIRAFDNPIVQDVIVKNIQKLSIFINNIELKIDSKLKIIHIFIGLDFLGKWFKNKEAMANSITTMLGKVFSEYNIKVYFNSHIWAKI